MAQEPFGMRLLVGGGLLHVGANPIADLPVGHGVADGLDEVLVVHPGRLQPPAIESLAEIRLVVRVEFAGQLQAGLVDVTGQVGPAIHGFAGTAREDDFTAHVCESCRAGRDGVNAAGLAPVAGRGERRDMAETHDFDVAVVGGGSGGYAAARTCAAVGQRVAIIDGAKELGGLCILRGCMPTKALLWATDVLHLAQQGSTWGLRLDKPAFDFKAVMARKAAVIEEFAGFRRKQLESDRFTLFRAVAKFIDPHTVELSDGRKVHADHFVIATGSIVSGPPLPALTQTGYLTSDDALALETLPKSLIVLGGGSVAVEFAQFFQRLGVAVTLVQRSGHILRDSDGDAAEAVTAQLRDEGMRVLTGTRLVDARVNALGLKEIVFTHEGGEKVIAAEQILFALGRSPNTKNLGLASVGVATEADGRVRMDTQMRTTVPHIYAAGDCASPFEIVHVAVQQGEIIGHNITTPAKPTTIDYRLLINVVFTDPALATVGLTEKSARAAGVPFVAASYPFNDHGKSIIMAVKHGFVKLLAAPDTGEILGGCCTGPQAGELIHEIVVAMAKRMNVRELAALPHYHPTLAEIWTYPAEELADQIGI